MRVLGPWLVYLCVVVLGGALLALWAYRAVQPAAARLPSLRPLAEQPFHRHANCSLRGLAGGPAVAAGAWDWRTDLALGEVVRLVVMPAGSAVAVAVIEQTRFRGLLQDTLRRVWRAGAAVALSSAVYAVAHFQNLVRGDAPVDWADGPGMLARMLAGFGEWAQVMPGFLYLRLASVLLGVAFERSDSLYFSTGPHAGWVFALKLYATTQAAAAGPTALWGSSKLTHGWTALPALAVTTAQLPWALRRPPARAQS